MDIGENLKKGKRGILQVIFGRTMIILLLLLIQFLFMFYLMFSAGRYIPYIFGSITAFTVIMLLIVLNTNANASIKLSWCFFISVLPVFGSLMYLFIRTDLGHRVEQRAIQRTLTESAKYFPKNSQVYEGIEDKSFYNLSYYLKNNGFPVYNAEEIEYFPLGEDKFREMTACLEKAEKYIFLEYFIIKEGTMWNRILDILTEKAKQGVEIRILYDGTNSVFNLPYNYPKKLKKLNIKCKMYSPLRPFVSTHYNNRDHRKILVIDGKIAFTGGVNLADEYINFTAPYGHWKDTAVKIQGQAVNSFTLMFLQMWNYNERDRQYEKYLTNNTVKLFKGYVIPYGDNPMDEENLGEAVYLDIINKATDYVYIMTPYLILDDEMKNALSSAAKRGVDVRIILPKKPDHIYAYVLAEDHYPDLMNAGVKIYSYTPGFIHAKVFLSDNKIATVGSINLDYRSLYLHFECGLLMYDTECIPKIYSDFEKTFKESHLIDKNDLKKRGLLSRISSFILKAVAPLM